MDEELKNENIAENEKTGNEFNADRGVIVLSEPIRARSADIDRLEYDFTKLTNRAYIDALNSDKGASDPFHITGKQAFELFCAAAAAVTEGVDATDIRERLNVRDTVFAVQVAQVFFAVTTRAAATRIAKG